MPKDALHSLGLRDLVQSKKFLITLGSMIALLCPLALLSDSAGEHREQYLSISTLDTNLRAETYFQGTNAISAAESVNWTLKVSNGMKEAEYLSLRIKVLNSTDLIPSDLLNTPSSNQELYEYRILVPKDAETTIPLEWSILDAENHENYVSIRTMKINGQIKDNLDIQSVNGQNFRMVIELWKYDTASESFNFAWSANNKENSVWNQIWFSIDN